MNPHGSRSAGAASTRPMSISTRRLAAFVAFLALAAPAGLPAQGEPSPDDYDFEVRTSKPSYSPGEDVVAEVGIVVRKADVEGWSYGVEHDAALLNLTGATIQDTDVPGILANGFEQTTLVIRESATVGFFQAVILTFGAEPVVLPISSFFRTSRATYQIRPEACTGMEGDLRTALQFSDELGANPKRPVETVLTVGGGQSVKPSRIENVDVVIACGAAPEGGLVLSFDPAQADLVADQSSTFPLKVLLGNTRDSGSVDFLGWSYGIQLDAGELEATEGDPGVDSQALKGGVGPDFAHYEEEESADGSVRGVIVGVVIDLGAPGTNVLNVAAGATKHIDTITLRSRQTIPPGSPPRMTTIRFVSEVLGGGPGRDPIEVILNSGGNSLTPDFSATKVLNLLPATVDRGRFLRGDANKDARVDIADGIWIINELFFSGPETDCPAAADANDDDRNDLADAMFIIQYQLQPMRTPSNLFPAPPAPFPNCGTDPDVSTTECPAGSTSC